MKLAVFDTHAFEKDFFEEANAEFGFEITFFEARLTKQTASLAAGFGVICSFVNDQIDRETLKILKQEGIKLIALRSAGFNQVDLNSALEFGIPVVRVPEYSPYAVAEHAVCLILALDRKIYRAHARVREGNFSLNGLVGFDLHGKTVGIVGTGKIGAALCRIMLGFGCKVLAFDLSPRGDLTSQGVRYVDMDEVFKSSDIISLHLPLTPETHHILDAEAFRQVKEGVMIVNTGRGALIDTVALIEALKSGRVGSAGLDVYEEEEGIFFQDLSNHVLRDDVLARLLTFPNVLVTSHQGFLTREALKNIAKTTLTNIKEFQEQRALKNQVLAQNAVRKKK